MWAFPCGSGYSLYLFCCHAELVEAQQKRMPLLSLAQKNKKKREMNTYIIDGIRTPIGNYKGTLSPVRTDDLGALVIKEIVKRNPNIPKEAYDDVILGCANQAGEDNRNVARMCSLLAGLPHSVPGETVNRLCSSGLVPGQGA